MVEFCCFVFQKYKLFSVVFMVMAAKKNAVKTQHALKVLESLDRLRAWGWICDFDIRVGRESFSVHRTVLAACSKYFEELFAKGGLEASQGFVEILDADARAVRRCIEFMYTGEATITLENVEHILPAAGLLQLSDLAELCLEFLKNNVDREKCLYIQRMCQEYGCMEIQKNVEKYIIDNMADVIGTEGFNSLEREELLHYLKFPGLDHGVIWDVVTTWVKFLERDRKKHFFELLSPNFVKFPPGFLLDTAWHEPLVQQSKPVRDMLIVVLFSDVQALKESITIGNCFLVKRLCEGSHIRDRVTIYDEAKVFMMRHFEAISAMPEFCNLPKEEILQIFRSPKTRYSTEVAKWEAALKWIDHSTAQRKRIFPDLFKTIKLENLPLNFINEVVRPHPLVKGCNACTELIMDALVARANPSSDEFSTPSKRPRVAGSKVKEHGAEGGKSPQIKTPKAKKQKEQEETVPKVVEEIPKTHIAVLYRSVGLIKGFDLENKWKLFTKRRSSQENFCSIVSLKGNLYLIDGNSLSCFENKTWKELGSLKRKPSKEAKAVAFRDSIHVVDSNGMTWYNPTANAWVEEAASAFGEGFCVASTQDFIYILGGSINANRAMRYDPVGENYTEVAPMVKGRVGAAAAALRDMVYVLGGVSDQKTNTAEEYDPGSGSWTYIKSMQSPRACFCACVVDDKIYAVGGNAGANGRMDSVEVYEKAKGGYRWKVLHQMMKAEPPFSAAVISAYLP